MAPPDCIILLRCTIIGKNCINTVTSMYVDVQNVNRLLLNNPNILTCNFPGHLLVWTY